MEPKILQATTEDTGTRLDSFLSSRLDGVSRSAAARLLESGQVLRNGKALSKSDRISGDETIFVTLPEVKLLDQNFIDEASSRSFFETGSWSNKDRKAMYERARQRMLSRCLTEENLNTARLNAREQIGRMLRPIAEPKVIHVK